MTRGLQYAKSSRKGRSIHRERVQVDDDYEVVHTRAVGSRSSRNPQDRPGQVSPQRGRTDWTVHEGDSWFPADDTQFSLEPDSSYCDDELEAEIYTSEVFLNQSKDKKDTDTKNKRSRLSVRLLFPWLSVEVVLASTPHYLDGTIPNHIS
jgi:hypothetical protein